MEVLESPRELGKWREMTAPDKSRICKQLELEDKCGLDSREGSDVL